MADTVLENGDVQSFYFPVNHDQAGWFKGVHCILEERGINVKDNKGKLLKLECVEKTRAEQGKTHTRSFACADNATHCCMRRVLFNQPDFVNVKPELQVMGEDLGVEVLFLPKFHCKLNFIEQCWGYANQIYWRFPRTSRKEDLLPNVLEALNQVPLHTMRK